MWKVVRASVVGTSHSSSNQPCQDSCFADALPTKSGEVFLVALAADGAGSAVKGGHGAELACETVVRSIVLSLENKASSLNDSDVEEWIGSAQRAIHEEAEANALRPRDYACTLLGAVIGERFSIFFQIGDGSIIACSGDVQGVVFWPDSGEYANMTYFVTDEAGISHLRTQLTTARIDEIAVFTDGIQRLALSFEHRIPHTPFFDSMFLELRKRTPDTCELLDEQLVRFLGSPDVNERTDDDKTLILATRREA